MVWDPGEDHDACSEEGLTAVCIEGEFDVWAMSVTRDIVVSDYDPAWPEWFEAVYGHVWPAVEDIAPRIDHVGSTAVPGLAAKPIIDMDVVVTTADDLSEVIERLASIGYRWLGDLGVPGREAFELVGNQKLPAHQLYVVVKDNKAHLDHWLLRDLLREDAEARSTTPPSRDTTPSWPTGTWKCTWPRRRPSWPNSSPEHEPSGDSGRRPTGNRTSIRPDRHPAFSGTVWWAQGSRLMSSRSTLRATTWATCCASLGDSRWRYHRGFVLAGTTITALLLRDCLQRPAGDVIGRYRLLAHEGEVLPCSDRLRRGASAGPGSSPRSSIGVSTAPGHSTLTLTP